MGPLIHPSSFGFSALMRRPTTPDLSPAQERVLAARLRRKIHDVDASWAELDIYNVGRISHSDFMLALRKLGVRHVTDEKSFALMSRFKEKGNSSGEMTRAEYIACMQCLLATPPPARQLDKADLAALLLAANQEVRRALPGDRDSVLALLGGDGELSYEQLRVVLTNAGARLNDVDFSLFAHAHDEIGESNVDARELACVVANEPLLSSRSGNGGSNDDASVGGSTMRGAGGSTQMLDSSLMPGSAGGIGSSPRSARSTVLLKSLDSYRPWVELGIAPLVDPLTQTRFSLSKMARICMAKTGLSENETKTVQALVGRREILLELCRARDPSGSGTLPPRAFNDVLEILDVDCDPGALELLAYRYDAPAHTGKVMGYEAFIHAMHSLLEAPFHPTSPELALKGIGFESDGTPALAAARAAAKARAAAATLASAAAAAAAASRVQQNTPLFNTPQTPPVNALAFPSHYRVESSPTISPSTTTTVLALTPSPPRSIALSQNEETAASPVGLYAMMGEATKLTRRIADLCGKREGGWAVLAAELVREAEFTASPLSGGGGGSSRQGGSGASRLDLSPLGASARRDGAPGSSTMATLRLGARSIESRGSTNSPGSRGGGGGAGSTSVIPIAVLQRLLAKRGMPLTPRDLRILSARFAPTASSASESGTSNLIVDLGLLGREVGGAF